MASEARILINAIGATVIPILIIILVIFLIFFITRFFWCWYYKINARLQEQKRTNELLMQIYAVLQSNMGRTCEQQPPVPPVRPANPPPKT